MIKKRPWSCMTSALAYLLEMDEELLFEWIGHDGGMVVREGDSVTSRAGFHVQEINDALMRHTKYALVPIEMYPSNVCKVGDKPFFVLDDAKAALRFDWYLKNTNGLLLGVWKNRGHSHAFINKMGTIIGSDTGEIKTDLFGFEPRIYLMLYKGVEVVSSN